VFVERYGALDGLGARKVCVSVPEEEDPPPGLDPPPLWRGGKGRNGEVGLDPESPASTACPGQAAELNNSRCTALDRVSGLAVPILTVVYASQKQVNNRGRLPLCEIGGFLVNKAHPGSFMPGEAADPVLQQHADTSPSIPADSTGPGAHELERTAHQRYRTEFLQHAARSEGWDFVPPADVVLPTPRQLKDLWHVATVRTWTEYAAIIEELAAAQKLISELAAEQIRPDDLPGEGIAAVETRIDNKQRAIVQSIDSLRVATHCLQDHKWRELRAGDQYYAAQTAASSQH
jgi:hypothetical protein